MAITAPMKLSDFSGFISPNEAAPIFDDAQYMSAAQSLFRRIPLGASGEAIPVITSKPTANWVNEGEKKPATNMGFDKINVEPKTLAAIAVMSSKVVRANPANVTQQIRRGLSEAFARAFDYAVFHDLGGDGTGTSPFDVSLSQATKSVTVGTTTQANGGIHGDTVAALELMVKDGERLTDLVLTSQELVRMIKEAGIDFASLPDTAPDDPFAPYTGGGVIFGVTGGVTEAVIRRVLGDTSDATLATIAECGVRGLEGIKAFEVTAGDTTLRIAVANGLGNADKLIEKVESGEEFFHFIEIMACPDGCIGGGGQPPASNARKAERYDGLFNADKECELRNSEQNPALEGVYKLLNGREHELLHIHYPDHNR